MTPIYRSPDHDQTQAMQSLLLEHHIQTSIIETKKSKQANGASEVTWFELWLHNFADETRAKSMITQHEFTTFRTNMSSYRTAVKAQQDGEQTRKKIEYHKTDNKLTVVSDSVAPEHIVLDEQTTPVKTASKSREDLIPINNKRVFKRLGLLLGFSEQEIDKIEDSNNKLYRPWDADALMETVKNLKQKCS